jgi:uncharacterized protein
MATAFPQELIELFSDPDSTRLLATIDELGFPHLVVKQSLQLQEDGKLLYLELLESSSTNRNMVRSIWFDQKIAVSIRGKGDRSYQIKGRPVKSHIAGPVFRKHYQAVRERLGDVDLAAVWEIEPEQVIDQNFETRIAEEERRQPYFNHLDRLVKK